MQICFKNTTISVPKKKIAKEYALILSILKRHNIHWSTVLFNAVTTFLYKEELPTVPAFPLVVSEYLEAHSTDDYCDMEDSDRALVAALMLYCCAMMNISNSKRISTDNDSVFVKGQDFYVQVMERMNELHTIGREAFSAKYPLVEVKAEKKKKQKAKN